MVVRKIPSVVGIYFCTVESHFLRTLRETKIAHQEIGSSGIVSVAKSIQRETLFGLSYQG